MVSYYNFNLFHNVTDESWKNMQNSRTMLKIFYVYLILTLGFSINTVRGLSMCCRRTTSTLCKRNCKLLQLPHEDRFARRQRRRLSNIVATCPRSEINFWKCLAEMKLWKDFLAESPWRQQRQRRQSHGICCKEARHMSCEIQCLTSKNVTKILNENCNAIREPKLAQCVSRIHALRKCCQGAATEECKDTCIHYFKNSRYNSIMDGKAELERKCGKHSQQYKCVMNQSDYKNVIQDLRKCCSKATNTRCERECKQEFDKLQSFQTLFRRLAKVCGQLYKQHPMQKCFIETSEDKESPPPQETLLKRDRTTLATRGHAKFKEHCCDRAKSSQCQNWCTSMISSPNLMGLWDTMYLSCIQDPKEVELSNCMSDILEPCQLGEKSKMSFCSNFNNRPLELFRRRDVHGDNEARKLHQFWSNGRVEVLDFSLAFKDVTKCKPEMFKALACLIAVKPCDHSSTRRQVCRSDCEEMLEACLDSERNEELVSARTVCAAILPNFNQTGCISVHDYVRVPAANVRGRNDEVTKPCDGNPCSDREVCTINSACSETELSARLCKPYKCVPGCVISHQSKVIVPVGQLAKLRVENRGRPCYQICRCTRHVSKRLSIPTYYDWKFCKDFDCRSKRRKCTMKNREFYDGDTFSDGCNSCKCVNGELICTKNHCANVIRTNFNGLCDCGNIYSPVCGNTGMTYPNPCVARCCRMEDYQLNIGDCHSVDPCDPDPCTHGERCIPKRTVCLTNLVPCDQHECVKEWSYQPTVCSSSELEDTTSVCGYDAVAYRNRSLAYASGTGIDYDGPCLPPPRNQGKARCAYVKCRPIGAERCEGFIPPGACCPICGSMLRIVYSIRDLTRHHKYINNVPITVLDLVKQLRQLQRVAECTLYGHRSIEGDIVILIVVNTGRPTRRQVHACGVEAERINKYINNESPMVTQYYHLSILKLSRLKKSKWKMDVDSSGATLLGRSHYAVMLFCILLAIVGCR